MAHCGPVARGSFVQTLVLTDIATGWTECAPLLVREQRLLTEVLGEMFCESDLRRHEGGSRAARRSNALSHCSVAFGHSGRRAP